jgi:hypothetical protein
MEDGVVYYYDSHPTEKDLMGQSTMHSTLVHYLVEVLLWMFPRDVGTIYRNLNFYHTPDPYEYPQEPDIAVIKGVPFRHARSWHIGKSGPAPHVVFEIGAEGTWEKDLKEKPLKYGQMGVQEYFAYDPEDPPLTQNTPQRLFGWKLDGDRHEMKEMAPGSNGSLWSAQLDSWLVPDGTMLRLYDRNRNRRLTQAEFLAEKLRSLGNDPDKI